MGGKEETTKKVVSNLLLFLLVFGLAVTVESNGVQKTKKTFKFGHRSRVSIVVLPVLGFVCCLVFFKDDPLYGIPLIATASSLEAVIAIGGVLYSTRIYRYRWR